jgi:hypothetical protein
MYDQYKRLFIIIMCYLFTECCSPIDEIQYLVSEILLTTWRNEEDEQTKKKHLTESINEVIQWINE